MTSALKALAGSLMILGLVGCTENTPVAPDALYPDEYETLAAKPNCDEDSSHPSCKGDDDGGGGDDGTSSSTVDLSGNYTAADQPVDVSEGGKYLRLDAPAEAPITLSVALPLIDSNYFPGICSHDGFASDQEAVDFWNTHAVEGGPGRRLRVQVDKKAVGSESTSHFTEVFWNSGELLLKMRNGNHPDYGPATWTGGGDSYTLDGGALSLLLPTGDKRVLCDADAMGTSFTFNLTR